MKKFKVMFATDSAVRELSKSMFAESLKANGRGIGQFRDGTIGCMPFATNSAVRKLSKPMFAERFKGERNWTIS